MKFLVVLFAVAAVAFAKPGFTTLAYAALPEVYSHGYTSFAVPAVVPRSLTALSSRVVTPISAVLGVTSQYHTQDELGRASYGHSEPLQSHNAIQDEQGNKIGSFSYVSPDGQVLRTDYIADALGYRVTSNALPVGPAPVTDTPEVVAARSAHLVHHERTKRDLTAVAGLTPASTSFLGRGNMAPFVHSVPVTHAAYITPYAYYAYFR